ncbi:flagellar hook-basal body complex protein [Altererythrobacter sp. Z27]|uniref:flagellar hook-basal body complex protein n=1 Tax=Altererythrobacter sp. Z27 TaxID=3461147 RepID=UPI004044455F
MGLLETAAATLIGGERRVETCARNITNVNTPGYKREVAFTQLLGGSGVPVRQAQPLPQVTSLRQMTQSALVETGNALDLAIDGTGFLLLRSGDRYSLVRGGQFALGPQGTVTDPLGRVLQQAGGGDLVVGAGAIDFLADGTVLEDGAPIGAIGIYASGPEAPGEQFPIDRAAALPEAIGSELRQGMLESSNVTLSDEMVELMRSQRQVESGAQLVRAYDRLISQAVSTFSRSS